MKSELLNSPKFKRLCRVVGLPRPYVAGLLELLWQAGYALASDAIGDAVDVETASEWPGEPGKWHAALVSEGWLDVDDSMTSHIHDFWEHAPQYVERKRKRLNDKRSKIEHERSKSAAVTRASDSRKRRKSPSSSEVTAVYKVDDQQLASDEPVTSHKLAYPTQPNPTQPYEENTPVVPKGTDEPDSRFDEFFELFPKQRRDGREKCRKAWKSKGLDAIAADVIAGLKRWIVSEDWTKDGGSFVKGTIAWINAGKWEAFPKPAAQGMFEINHPSDADIQAELREAE